MAKFQCFTRYLQEVSADFTCIESVAENDFQKFQETFFPNGLDHAQAVDTVSYIISAFFIFIDNGCVVLIINPEFSGCKNWKCLLVVVIM